ncbi:CpsD/CapB family tyrosine-protein kinase [Bacillus sp. CGMCC 1.16607]|uniref:CpsD/CapB family tyrosine-protein kinase n=1 Tax=Bacillus sp. CGMCC 1.16607 TaxID=3351842 RepID=UPI003636DB3D
MKDREKKDNRAVHLIAHSYPMMPITEQYRQIRSNILFTSADKGIKSIIITSPEPKEGKSTTAANLSIVLAQQGKRVLLVDADLRKPSVHLDFKVSNVEGLTNILTYKIRLEEAITDTYIPNLHLLTSGPLPPNPSELLNSETMDILMQELKEKYEFIIFDSPPILAVTDPQILANKCDGVVMVVSSGKTRKDKAIKAKELLEKAKSHFLGVVVNGVEEKSSDYYSQY